MKHNVYDVEIKPCKFGDMKITKHTESDCDLKTSTKT